MKQLIPIILFTIAFLSCDRNNTPMDNTPMDEEMYFPPTTGSDWESVDLETLEWNKNEIENLYNFLEEKDTRAFIVLKDGKIAMEQYWGNNILNTGSFDVDSDWYWASAGKTLTASLVGAAQKEGLLDIDHKTSDYLGNGWTSLDSEKEDLITIKNQLTMTSGLDYLTASLDCTDASCLEYKSDAGTQWYYHNAPYTLLESVVTNASGIEYNYYTDQKLQSLIGLSGNWLKLDYNNVYFSTAREMARFGLLTMNKGVWNESEPLYDENFYNQMINSSQDLNLSYGYLWWLNGKSSIIAPGLPTTFNVQLSNNAPDDLFAGMGKNGQFVEIIPSQGLVVIRMGEAPDGSATAIDFHDEM